MKRMADLRASIALGLVVTAVVVSPARSEESVGPWEAKFNEVYRLADGENAKLIPPPFTPERGAYHQKHNSQIVRIPGQYGFRWKNGKLEQRYWSTDPGTVASALYMANIDVADLDGVRDVFDVKVPGDWIVRAGAPREAILADIQRELTKATNGRIRVEPARIEKDVIVASGTYAFKPLPNAGRRPDSVHLFTDTMDPEEGAGGGTGTMDEFLRRIGDVVDLKVINETKPRKAKVEWTNNNSIHSAAKSDEKRNQLLKNVTEQTSLEFKVERRMIDVWRVIDTTNAAGGL